MEHRRFGATESWRR